MYMIKTLPKQKLGYWPVGTQIGWLSSTGPTSTMRTLLGLPSAGQGLLGEQSLPVLRSMPGVNKVDTRGPKHIMLARWGSIWHLQ